MNGIELYMGQAVLANLNELWLSSGNFDTCTAIILCNHKTNMGALFHYPAGALLKEDDGTAAHTEALLKALIKALGLNANNATIFRMQGPDANLDNGLKVSMNGDSHYDMKAIDDVFKSQGLKPGVLPRNTYVRIGVENQRIVWSQQGMGNVRDLRHENGGIKGKAMKVFNKCNIRVFGEDLWNEEAKEVVIKIETKAVKAKAKSGDDEDESYRQSQDAKNYWYRWYKDNAASQ